MKINWNKVIKVAKYLITIASIITIASTILGTLAVQDCVPLIQ